MESLTPLSRRTALSVGGASLLGLTYPQLLSAVEKARSKARAKAVIFLHQWGGAGHHETFDMKPDAPDKVRGWFQPMSSRVPGTLVCEKLPRVAEITDKLCIVRCMRHTAPMKNHNSAGYYSLTGIAPPTDDQRLRDSNDLFPAYGSIVDKLAPAAKGAATFVSFPHVIADGSITPGQHASFLGKTHNPLFVNEDPNGADFRLPELSLPDGLTPSRLESRTEILKLIDSQADLMEKSAVARGVDESYRRAVSMLTSPRFKEAFDLTREKKATRERFGRTTYGQSCLLARRLVEAGAKFVNVYFSRAIGGTGQGWDYHGFNGESVTNRLNELLPLTDQTLSALVLDLHERGLLDSTLVVWVGEFGRTPRISSNGGRDHWPQCYTAVLAGGGTKAGFVYGASDKIGAYPTIGQASPEDLAATMFDSLGLDPEAEIRDAFNRPLPISRGKVMKEILA
ncbi:DUF1501 domain-containing protein [Fimbriiglobus ruber]|uniref:DUF1501 domain-containing protein n=1 Tax=Fimbriiglobus ruber TaxID=1908690 RepID=A0A225DXG1_9BACT|nr:DUF1501 domain-containing protein [Fimbriiglobus ruber]OWK43218.1 hypothetical protein FRUB_02817 [Fimbriiglobus ruber]